MIYCLNNGLPLDIDVYDAAEWSSLVEASRKSVQLNGAPVAIPDFTRGDWDTLKEVVYHMGGAGATELKPAGKPAKNVYAQVADSFLKLSDPAGDAGAGVVDFIGGAIQVKGGNLELYYTAAAPIEQSKLSYHLKVLIAVGTEGGYDNAGTRYLVERGLLYRFNGDKPFQWKWEKITAISVRFQQQFCEMSVPLNLIAPEPDRISVRFRCLEDYMPNAEMPAAVLTPGNLAANPATKVDTSSSRERYSPGALNDGQISPELPWEKAAWASLETEEDKFITFSFPVKKQLKRVIIYWEKASREMLIQFPEGNGWKTVGTVAPGAGDRSSVVDLEGSLPETNQVRFLQTAGKGSAGRPQLVWIREIEIY